MKAKFELKLNMQRLSRAIKSIEREEKLFYSANSLWETSLKTKNVELSKKMFQRVEKRRDSWYKAIDEKMKLEQIIKVLEKKVIEDVLKEIM